MDNNTIKIYVGNEFIGFFKVFNGEIKIPRQQFNDIMEELNKMIPGYMITNFCGIVLFSIGF